MSRGTTGKSTLRDVARAAGVDPSTVSRALTPVPDRPVSTDTARRIRREAKRLGFQPNNLARGLRTRRSSTVGLLVPDITNPLMPPLMCGVEEELAEHGYTVLLAATRNDAEIERRSLSTFAARQVDGLIVASAQVEDASVRDVGTLGIPTVLAMRRDARSKLPFVVADEAYGIWLALEHLVELGHTSVLYVSGSIMGSHIADRLAGFEQAVKTLGLDPADCPHVVCDGYGVEHGASAVRDALVQHEFTAVVAGNVLMALGCYDALHEAGLSCPADMSVIGFNDMPMADHVSPPMTAVHTPFHEMGTVAARLLLRHVDQPEAPIESLRLKPRLVVRSSTARPAGSGRR